jgi:hypothetical protein
VTNTTSERGSPAIIGYVASRLMVTCECGHRWRSYSVSGRTHCPRCDRRIYIPAAERRAAGLRGFDAPASPAVTKRDHSIAHHHFPGSASVKGARVNHDRGPAWSRSLRHRHDSYGRSRTPVRAGCKARGRDTSSSWGSAGFSENPGTVLTATPGPFLPALSHRHLSMRDRRVSDASKLSVHFDF